MSASSAAGRWLAVVLCAAAVLWIGTSPALPVNGTVGRLLLRKGIHLAEYAALGFLLVLALAPSGRRPGRARLLGALAVAVAVAAVDEAHQLFVARRDGRLLDVGLDTLGAALGLGTALAWARLRSEARGRRPQGRRGAS
jgi:VanZ family protein